MSFLAKATDPFNDGRKEPQSIYVFHGGYRNSHVSAVPTLVVPSPGPFSSRSKTPMDTAWKVNSQRARGYRCREKSTVVRRGALFYCGWEVGGWILAVCVEGRRLRRQMNVWGWWRRIYSFDEALSWWALLISGMLFFDVCMHGRCWVILLSSGRFRFGGLMVLPRVIRAVS